MKNNRFLMLKNMASLPMLARRQQTSVLGAACCALLCAAPVLAAETAPVVETAPVAPTTGAAKSIEALPDAALSPEIASPAPVEQIAPSSALGVDASTRAESQAPITSPAPLPSSRPNVLVIPLDDLVYDAVPTAPSKPMSAAAPSIAPAATPSITLVPAAFFGGGGFSNLIWNARVLAPRLVQAPNLSFSNNLPQAMSDGVADIEPPGPAQLAASALRRALLKRNWNDVLTAAPDSAVIRRAIMEKRVLPAELQALRSAMAQLVAGDVTKPPSNRDGAVQIASRVGQSLGYRAVILLAVAPQDSAIGGTSQKSANYTMLAVDAVRENGEVLRFSQSGATTVRLNEAAATTALSTLETSLGSFGAVSRVERTDRLRDYLADGRAALQSGNAEEAKSQAARALAFSPSNGEANILMGDALRVTDPAAAVPFYKRVLGSRALTAGEVWERIATAYAAAKDWPNTLEAGRRAMAGGTDSASLRMTLATAQFGRAQLFKEAGRADSADAAIADARDQLDKAKAMAPGDPSVARLLASNLIDQKMYREALQTLDVFVAKFPDDLDLQKLYAQALTEIGGRNAEAFRAWARVWSLDGTSSAPVTQSQYRKLAGAFDEYAAALAKRSAQLAMAVASDTLPRDASLLQIIRIGNQMSAAVTALKVMNPERSTETHATRVFAADLLVQAIDNYRTYIAKGESADLTRAAALHRQAILQLNAVRNGSG